MAAAYDNGRQRQRPTLTAVVAYNDKGDNGLQQCQTTAAAYDGGSSGLHQWQATAVAYEE